MDDQRIVTMDDLRELLEVLKHAVAAAGEMSKRIEILEKASRETFTVLTSLQENQQNLLDFVQKHANAQNQFNDDVAKAVQRLAGEIDRLKGPGFVM